VTYGGYNRNLKSVSLSGQYSIDDCKKYLWRDTDVICSEKEVWCSLSIKITFHAWRGFRWFRWDPSITLGFVTIEKKNNYYTWADKIVYDPLKEGGAK
jgi:hypothetical protein